jgi:hypothetical protein
VSTFHLKNAWLGLWQVRDLAGWHYAVTVVDLDAKPASKIPHYYQQDRDIATLFAQHLLEEEESRASA